MVSRALRVSNTSPPNHFTLQTSTSMLLQYEQTCSTTSEERSEQSEQRSERRTAEQRWRLLDDLWLISCVLWISDYVALWLVLICCCVSSILTISTDSWHTHTNSSNQISRPVDLLSVNSTFPGASWPQHHMTAATILNQSIHWSRVWYPHVKTFYWLNHQLFIK